MPVPKCSMCKGFIYSHFPHRCPPVWLVFQCEGELSSLERNNPLVIDDDLYGVERVYALDAEAAAVSCADTWFHEDHDFDQTLYFVVIREADDDWQEDGCRVWQPEICHYISVSAQPSVHFSAREF